MFVVVSCFYSRTNRIYLDPCQFRWRIGFYNQLKFNRTKVRSSKRRLEVTGWSDRTPKKNCLAISSHHSAEERGLYLHDEVARRWCKEAWVFPASLVQGSEWPLTSGVILYYNFLYGCCGQQCLDISSIFYFEIDRDGSRVEHTHTHIHTHTCTLHIATRKNWIVVFIVIHNIYVFLLQYVICSTA